MKGKLKEVVCLGSYSGVIKDKVCPELAYLLLVSSHSWLQESNRVWVFGLVCGFLWLVVWGFFCLLNYSNRHCTASTCTLPLQCLLRARPKAPFIFPIAAFFWLHGALCAPIPAGAGAPACPTGELIFPGRPGEGLILTLLACENWWLILLPIK